MLERGASKDEILLIVDAMSDREVTGQTGVSAHGETRDGGPPAGVTTFAET
jgi:hypothetical protein